MRGGRLNSVRLQGRERIPRRRLGMTGWRNSPSRMAVLFASPKSVCGALDYSLLITDDRLPTHAASRPPAEEPRRRTSACLRDN